MLENAVREDLNKRAPRVMAVLKPIKVVLTNYPPGKSRSSMRSTIPRIRRPVRAKCHSVASSTSSKTTSEKCRQEVLPTRTGPRSAAPLGVLHQVSRSDQGSHDGEITELHCTYDPETRGGNAPDGRKVQGTIHWVSAAQAPTCRSAALRSSVQSTRPGRCAAGCRLENELESRRW